MKKSARRSSAASLAKLSDGTLQIGGIDLAGPVLSRPQLRNTAGIDVKANDGASVARKGRRDRQSDITETNDGNLPAV